MISGWIGAAQDVRLALRSLRTTPIVTSAALSDAAVIVGAGVACGTAIGIWATTLVASLLFGVRPRDPITFIEAAAVVSVVGLIASLVPAGRASRLDPSELLREG